MGRREDQAEQARVEYIDRHLLRPFDVSTLRLRSLNLYIRSSADSGEAVVEFHLPGGKERSILWDEFDFRGTVGGSENLIILPSRCNHSPESKVGTFLEIHPTKPGEDVLLKTFIVEKDGWLKDTIEEVSRTNLRALLEERRDAIVRPYIEKGMGRKLVRDPAPQAA